MTNKVYQMNNPKNSTAIPLLPNKCKIGGLLLILICLIPAIIIHTGGVHLSAGDKEKLTAITFGIFAIGLSLIAWAKDKIEDERTVLLRLKAMAAAFGYAVFYTAFQPFAYTLVGGGAAGLSARELVTTMLLAYLFTYYAQKRSR